MRAREPDVWSIRASTKVREPTGAVSSTAHLPAEEKGAHKSHLSVGQVVEIFKRKTSKTGGTASLLSQQYGVGDRTIRDIWGGKTWAKETRPFWTPLEHQQSLASGASVEAENSVQSGQGPDSGATHHGTDTHLPAVEKGAHMRHLTAGQVVEIFKRKTSKTVGTSSLLSQQYGVGSQTIRDIWAGKTWAKETRPFWTPLEHQQSLASGTSVAAENSAESGPGPDSGATHHGTDTHLPAEEKGAHKSHLTVEQVVEIFKRKTSKTVHTASLLSQQYGVGSQTIRDIWAGRTWAKETRPFWTPLEHQQSLASGTSVEGENSALSRKNID